MTNPFEHHHHHDEHEHGPNCGHDAAHGEIADPAQRSLGDALRVSFAILKYVMLILVVFYLFSGVFNVRANEVAVRLRFGEIVGEEGRQVLSPGWYLGLPFPVEQVVKVDKTRVQQIDLNREFWIHSYTGAQTATDEELIRHTTELDPEKDGSLITGDAGLVHVQWRVSYQVIDPVAYLKNVKEYERGERLVRLAAEQAAVNALAQVSADDLLASTKDEDLAMIRANEVLQSLRTGLKVTAFKRSRFLFPGSVLPAIEAVAGAQNDRGRNIAQAQSKRTKILAGVAGDAAEPLKLLIARYDDAMQAGDQAVVRRLDDIFNNAFENLRLPDEAFAMLNLPTPAQPTLITGEVAAIVSKAKAERVGLVQSIQGEAALFAEWLPLFKKDPQLALNRLYEPAREELLARAVEIFYVPRGQAWFMLNRDPQVRRRMEEAAQQSAAEAAKKKNDD